MGSMLDERPLREPSELVIWGASSLLAAIVGIGVSFGLWMQLHQTKHTAILMTAVLAISLGLGLIGLAVRTRLTRVFLLVLAGTLLAGFLAASPALALFGA